MKEFVSMMLDQYPWWTLYFTLVLMICVASVKEGK